MELKDIITEKKFTRDINNIFELVKEITSELEEELIEIMQSREETEALEKHGTPLKTPKYIDIHNETTRRKE